MPFSDIFEATYTHYFWDPTFFWLTLYLQEAAAILGPQNRIQGRCGMNINKNQKL